MKSFPYVLHIPVADIICELHFQNKEHKKFYEDSCIFLETLPRVHNSIKIFLEETSDFYLLSSFPKKTKIRVKKQDLVSFNDIVLLVEVLMEYNLAFRRVLFFHGSSFVKNGKGYAFSAPSGTGKSTIVSKVPKKDVLSDDLLVLKKIKNRFYIYTSPFDKATIPNLVFQAAPLDTLFFLEQEVFTKIEDESLEDKIYNLLISNLLLGWNKLQIENNKGIGKSAEKKVHSLIFDLVKSCNIRTLYFTKDSKPFSDF